MKTYNTYIGKGFGNPGDFGKYQFTGIETGKLSIQGEEADSL